MGWRLRTSLPPAASLTFDRPVNLTTIFTHLTRNGFQVMAGMRYRLLMSSRSCAARSKRATDLR